jgi:hypothetical protein
LETDRDDALIEQAASAVHQRQGAVGEARGEEG